MKENKWYTAISVPVCVCVSVCVVSAGQGLQSQSAAHADDVLMSYVSPAACQDQSSTHTPATNTYTHSFSEPDSTAPWPRRARQRRTHPGFQAPQTAVTVDLTSAYFVDMGDMGDPPKSKRLARSWGAMVEVNSS